MKTNPDDLFEDFHYTLCAVCHFLSERDDNVSIRLYDEVSKISTRFRQWVERDYPKLKNEGEANDQTLPLSS